MILFPVALFFMIFSLCTGSTETTNLSENTGKVKEEEVAHLEILLPGVNLPLNQIGYYIVSLLVCSFVHEAGNDC
jgi:S2P endopeptidase